MRRHRLAALSAAVTLLTVIVPTMQTIPARAACAPTAAAADECVEYGTASFQQTMDIWYGTKTVAAPRPAVLMIHPGGWYGGSKNFFTGMPVAQVIGNTVVGPKTGFVNMGTEFADGHGWVAFSMNYRLGRNVTTGAAGQTTQPYIDQPADVEAAVRWIRTNAAAYSIDPNRIGLVGASAGAHLALLHAMRSKTQPVKAVVSWAGPTNLTTLSLLHGCVTKNCPPLPNQVPVGQLIQMWVGDCGAVLNLNCRDRYVNGSPTNHVDVNDPATLLVHGALDNVVPIEQAIEMRARLLAVLQKPHELRICANCSHGAVGDFQLGAYAWYHTERFLQQRL